MRLNLDIDTHPWLEEHPERFMELLRGKLFELINQEFPNDIQGFELAIDNDTTDDGVCSPCPHCAELTSIHLRRCEECGEPRY